MKPHKPLDAIVTYGAVLSFQQACDKFHAEAKLLFPGYGVYDSRSEVDGEDHNYPNGKSQYSVEVTPEGAALLLGSMSVPALIFMRSILGVISHTPFPYQLFSAMVDAVDALKADEQSRHGPYNGEESKHTHPVTYLRRILADALLYGDAEGCSGSGTVGEDGSEAISVGWTVYPAQTYKNYR